ncbi:MAG TPA: hypothetical protein DHW82_10265 [Spirochaetia bacterium]|nr:MAG: hypothetical protein A2Y41_00600 [Spirochaetes bacterium GWB1_36_13]HCL57375.1 hypothetical protein [Spirochaetia bacterium]
MDKIRKVSTKLIFFSLSLIFFITFFLALIAISEQRKMLYENIENESYAIAKSSTISIYQLYADTIGLSASRFFDIFKEKFEKLLQYKDNVKMKFIVRVMIIGKNGVVIFDSLDIEKADSYNYPSKKTFLFVEDPILLENLNTPKISLRKKINQSQDNLFINPNFYSENPKKLLGEILEITVPKPEVMGEHFVSVCYWVSYSSVEKATLKTILFSASVFIVFALFVSLIAVFFSKKLVSPILKLKKTILEMIGGNWRIRAAISSHDEIGKVAEYFNHLADKMDKYISKIKFLNKNLEIKVLERTQELAGERNKLKIRNEQIEKDILIAKKIQQQLIPLNSPVENISFFYKTMDEVGGDFYDFIVFKNGKEIGIFLSDVSGHGIPAAFITSMIKSFILQAGDMRKDPAFLFSYLNDLLINQTAGNFITAFYCIFNPETLTLTYSNAGHNLPCIIKNSQELSFFNPTHKSFPLAIFTNHELAEKNKSYQNYFLKLEQNSKLFLYTDGITETCKNNSNFCFEEELFEKTLLDLYSYDAKNFIHLFYKRLVEYKGDDHFSDDLCMICMDIL